MDDALGRRLVEFLCRQIVFFFQFFEGAFQRRQKSFDLGLMIRFVSAIAQTAFLGLA